MSAQHFSVDDILRLAQGLRDSGCVTATVADMSFSFIPKDMEPATSPKEGALTADMQFQRDLMWSAGR